MDKKIAVIGAGPTGLIAADVLTSNGFRAVVYEASDHIGGLSAVHDANGTPLENIYHHIFTSDAYLTELAERFGLKMIWTEPKDAFFVKNKVYPFTSPLDLLRFSHLPFIYRVTMGLLVLRAGLIKKIPEERNAREWVSALAGKPVYEKVWKPLMESKFDRDAEDVSAAWLWNKFKLRGSTRGKDIGKEMLGYLDGSFGLLYEKLRERVEANGGSVILRTAVKKITNAESKFRIEFENGSEDFDRVLYTGTPGQLVGLTGGLLSGAYRENCLAIKYKANLCAVVRTATKLSPYYWTTVADNEIPFVAVIEHTNMIPADLYGSNIVYLTRYLDCEDPLFTKSDDEIREAFFAGLKKIYDGFSPEDVAYFKLFRSKYAQPVIVKGYHKLLPEIKTPARGLYLCGMAQIYPEDRGQNYAAREAVKAAKIILNEMKG